MPRQVGKEVIESFIDEVKGYLPLIREAWLLISAIRAGLPISKTRTGLLTRSRACVDGRSGRIEPCRFPTGVVA